MSEQVEAESKQSTQRSVWLRGHHGPETGEREGQPRPRLFKTFVLKAAAVSCGNGKENTV